VTLRRYLFGAALLLLIWGVVVRITGGIDASLAGIPIRSRDAVRPLVAGGALFLVASIVYRAACTAMFDRAGAALRQSAVAIARTVTQPFGRVAADHLPANAALFAFQHGGSVRFYSGRITLRFD
jgi:hypothetical protein